MSQTQYTLLLVDDSSEDRELYRRFLLKDPACSYRVLEAATGRQGLALWHQHHPDIILLDYRLPDLDGLEILAQLSGSRQNSRQNSGQLPCLPVVMLTGLGNEAIAVKAIKAGAQDYLVKGQMTPESLQLAVHGAIETVQLHTQLHQRIERERVVSQITRQIHRSLDLDEILQTAVREVRAFLQTDRVVVFRLHSDGTGTVVTEAIGPEWTPLLSTSLYDPCFNTNYVERFRQGLVTVKPDIYDGSIDPCHVELLASLQVRANLVVPILQDNQLWGMLIAHHCAAPRQWQVLEIDLLKELATQLGIALKQAELYQQVQTELAEHKRTTAALRQSQETTQQQLAEIEAIYTMAPIGLCFVDLDLRFVRINQQLAEINGLSASKHLGRTLRSVLPKLADQLEPLYRQVIASGNPILNLEIQGTTPAQPGVERDWLMSYYPQKDGNDRVLGVNVMMQEITDRKRSEARFKLALEATGTVYWERDLSTDQIELSGTFTHPATLQSIPYPEALRLVHPEDQAKVDQANQTAIAERRGFELEHRLREPNDQTWRWVLVRGKVLTDSAGNPTRMVGVSIDISDRKQAEEALCQSQAIVARQLLEIEAIYDTAPIGLAVLDLDLRFQRINQQLAEINGLSVEDHLGRTMREMVPDLAEAAETLFYRVVETGAPLLNLEISGKTQAQPGVWRTWLESWFPLQDANGRVIGVNVVVQEITDRKRTEAALRESEEHLRYTVELNPQVPWTANPDGKITGFSQRWLELTGLTQEQAIDAGWMQAPHPDDVPAMVAAWMHSIQTGAPYDIEHRIKLADGSYRWMRSRALPRRNEQGEIIRWYGTSEDIDDRKQAEIERDRLLQCEQAARAEAERANCMKDEFLAILSHELRSPLNPILGWAKLMQTRKFDATKTAEALATIERNARLQTQLIDDLLDVAKILRGKLSLNVAPVSLAFVIEAAIDTVRTAAIAKSIFLHPVLPNLGQVSGDAARLQQIFWNLLSNAVKFTPHQGRVDICLNQVGNQAQVTISDTGKGINPDFLPHIFESFRQEDASTTRKYGGLGLGLAIVRSLVEAHGGTIWAESLGEGQGATFTVQLPLLTTEFANNQSDQQSAPEADLTGIRVLTVDDDLDARELLTAVLTQSGAEVLAVAAAAEALAALESFQPDIFISDIGMPDIDGYALIQAIRAIPAAQSKHLPAIALTAYARNEDQQQALKAGFQRHLSKPIHPDELVRVVSTLFNRSG